MFSGRQSFIFAANPPAVVSGWNLATASYDSKSFGVSSQETVPSSVFFKSDGTKMYVLGTSNDTAYQYSLSTAWDVSTASYDSKSFSVSSQDGTPTGLFFKSDGTKMYVIGDANNRVYQYSLSTAWDVSTASYDSINPSISPQDASATGIYFTSDGTKMYMIGGGNDRANQYSLSTAWDLSTLSYDSKYFSVASQDSGPHDLFFKSDGTKMYMIGVTSNTVYQYSLSTAWDVSTASYDSVSLSLTSYGSSPSFRGLFFGNNGTKLYAMSTDGGVDPKIYQFTLTA